MEAMQGILTRGQAVLIGNYARLPVAMVRGEGCWLWDADGNRYLDLFAGFGGCVLGHCQPDLVAAATEQAGKLWHVGNTFYTVPQIELAERLNRHAFQGKAFFCHSGAEANEAACKLARLKGQANGGQRWKIISLNKSFHGRTLAMISATGNPAVKAGFGPVVPGFVQVEGGDFDALAKAVDDETAGVLMEPMQGEGGINVYPSDYPQKVRELCDEKGLALIFDEVWTGCGRTGKWFGHQHFSGHMGGAAAKKEGSDCAVEPDVMTLGKAVGGGLPVGVMYAKPEIAALMVPGKHGSTLGGNPICMAVAAKIFDVIERDGLLKHATELGELAIARIREDGRLKEKLVEVRGKGLFLGIELKTVPEKLVERGLEKRLIVNLTAQKVVRVAPPINIDREDFEKGLRTLVELLAAS